jgi:hypothetical protein
MSQRFTFADVAVPLIILTPAQYQMYAGAPNLSHSAMPLLLLMLYVFAWAALSGTWRLVTILILNFLLIYSGFGFFAGLITPFLFGTEIVRAYRSHNQKDILLALACVIISVLSLLSFFTGYRYDPGVNSFWFPINEWWLYPLYMSLMIANFCGIKGISIISYTVGFFIIFLMIILAIYHWMRSLKGGISPTESRIDSVIAFLITFTLLFCAGTAIGRISSGLITAQFSRYITLMIPGFFGIYLWMVTRPAGMMRKFLLTAAVVCLIAATFPLREVDREYLKASLQGKSDWKNLYLLTEDSEMTTKLTGFCLCYLPERAHLNQKLEYLKKNKLNLYLDYHVPAGN